MNYVKRCHPFSIENLSQIIEAAYWVSHATEERNQTNVSLVLKKPDNVWDTYCFDHPISLEQNHLVKIGSALDSNFSDICLWPGKNKNLEIWGFKMRPLNHLTANLRILILGHGKVLIICYGRALAAITGNNGIFLNPEVLFKILLPTICLYDDFSNFKDQQYFAFTSLLHISQAMRAHEKGGTLLVVSEDTGWKKSLKQPIHYKGRARFMDTNQNAIPIPDLSFATKNPRELFNAICNPESKAMAELRLKFIEQCFYIGRLTATDGALVMSIDRHVRCFGAKIQPIGPLLGSTEVRVVRPVVGGKESKKIIADLGGTRHQSAAQFVHDQPGSIAIVASQDGNMSFITKDPSSEKLLIVEDAELVLMHEGILGSIWNLYRFFD